MVNEFRTGFNLDNVDRRSNFKAAEVAASLGLENAPSKAEAFGFPSFHVHRQARSVHSILSMPGATSIAG